MRQFLPNQLYQEIEPKLDHIKSNNNVLKKCIDTIEFIIKAHKHTVKEWKENLNIWDDLIEKLRTQWGEQWLFYRMAILGCHLDSCVKRSLPKEEHLRR